MEFYDVSVAAQVGRSSLPREAGVRYTSEMKPRMLICICASYQSAEVAAPGSPTDTSTTTTSPPRTQPRTRSTKLHIAPDLTGAEQRPGPRDAAGPTPASTRRRTAALDRGARRSSSPVVEAARVPASGARQLRLRTRVRCRIQPGTCAGDRRTTRAGRATPGCPARACTRQCAQSSPCGLRHRGAKAEP
jgi:hypothetical protein